MALEIQRESGGYTLDVLKNRLRPRDAVETSPGGDEYVVSPQKKTKKKQKKKKTK